MISIIHISARCANPFLRHPHWLQYAKLAEWLAAQTYRNFEVICVTPFPEDTTPIASLEQLTVAVPPRDTPWRRAKTRCSASARNTGLAHARGEYVVCLDDCCEVGPDYLERVAGWLQCGVGVATLSATADGTLVDGRVAGMGASKMVITKDAVALGLVAFPTELGLQLNGWDEHFDGGYGLEDADFGFRLSRAGLAMAMDQGIAARLHDTTGLDTSVVAPDGDPADPVRSNVRCCNSAFVLAREAGLQRANTIPYTREQIDRRMDCFMLHGDKCGYWRDRETCPYLHFARGGHPVARRIMIDEEYPETVDLVVERKRHGV